MAAQPNRDVTLIWRKSSASGGDGACVEVTVQSGSRVLIRDSRNASGMALEVPCARWREFVRRLKAGDDARR